MDNVKEDVMAQGTNIVGPVGALVESTPFIRRVMGSIVALAARKGPCCLWHFVVKLRHSIRAVSGAPLSSNGLEEAL